MVRKAHSVSSPSSRLPSVVISKQIGTSSRLDAVFSALADPTRRAILERLSQSEVSVGELAKPFQISPPAITKHLHVLEKAGMIARERDGRVHRLHLQPAPLLSTVTWMDQHRSLWETQLDALSDYFEAIKNKERDPV